MAYENPQFERLKQTIETKQQEETSRFGSAMADLLQKNNKITEQSLVLDKTAVSQMSQYFQTTIKLQTESNNILRQIAEILTKNSTAKNNQALIGSAAKQGINFDISREQPKKGIISNMWQATANANIQKEIRKANRKLAKSLGLSMTLTTAMTTPASSKFRGIVAETEMDFNVVNTNILLGMYELQRLSLQQLVDINKQTGVGVGKGSSVTSISNQQIRTERLQTDNFKDSFDTNVDPRKMMQKIGGIPLIGGYLQMITAPIKELLTLPSLPTRLKKGWTEFKEKHRLSGPDSTASLKRTGLYKSDQDRAYSFLGGDFIKIIENIRADAAAIRYQVTGEKPGTDPKTGKRLDQSRAELYDAIKGEFYSAKRDKTGKIISTAEEIRLETEKKRRKIIEEDINRELPWTSEIVRGLIEKVTSKEMRDRLGIMSIKEQAGVALGATRTGELAKVENEELNYRIKMNELYPEAIEQMDSFSSMLGVLSTTIGGVALSATGLPAGMSLAGGVAAGAIALYKAANLIKEQTFISEITSNETKIRDKPSLRAIRQQIDNESGPTKGSLAGMMGGWGEKSSLFPDDIKEKIYQFANDINTIAGYLEHLREKPLPIDIVQSINKRKQTTPVLVEFDKNNLKQIIDGKSASNDKNLKPKPKTHDTGGIVPKGKIGISSEKKRGGAYSLEYVNGLGLTVVPTLVAGPASITGASATENALQTIANSTSSLVSYFQVKDKQEKDISISEQIQQERTESDQEKRDKIQVNISDILKQIQGDQEDQTEFLKDTEKKKAKPVKKGFFESIFGGLSFLKGLGTMLLPLIPTVLGSIFSTGMSGIITPIIAGVTSFLTKYIFGGTLGLVWKAITGVAGEALSLITGGVTGLAGKAVGAAGGLAGKAVGAAGGLAGKAVSAAGGLAGKAVGPVSGMKSADLMKRLSAMFGTGVEATNIEGVVAGQGAVIGKATSGMLSKVAIPVIIATGLAQMFNDTVETGSLVEGIFGNMKEGGWADAFKGMSKYAAMGAAAGIVFGGIGAIPGAMIGAALGGIIGYFGTDKLGNLVDQGGDLVLKMNTAISDFFKEYSGEKASSWSAEFISSKIPLVMPLLGGILGSVVDSISWLWKKSKGVMVEVGDMIGYANFKIIDFFSTKYGKEGALNFSGIPIIGPVAGGVLGSIIDVFADVFSGDVKMPTLDIMNNQVVGIFKAIGPIAGNIAEFGKDHGFPIAGPLLYGFVGTALQGISWIIGDKATEDIKRGLTWDNANNLVTNIFYKVGPFAGDMAKFSSTRGVPIIGPLVGGLFGSVIDIIRGVISSPESEAEMKIFGARVSEAWTALILDFKEAYNSMINAIKGGWSATKKFFGFEDGTVTNSGLIDINADREKLKQKTESTDKLVTELESLRQKEFDDMMAKRAKEKEEKERLYEKYDTPAGTPTPPKIEETKKEETKKEETAIISDKVKDVTDLAKTATSTVKDVSTGLIKTSLKVSEELQANSTEFKDQALDGINWLGNSIFIAFKSMGAMFLGIVQKLSGWFRDNAPEYYEKNIKPALESAGSALKTGGEFTVDFTKNTALPALGSAAVAVKDFTVNTAIPAIKSGAQTVGSSVATGAAVAGSAISGVAANIGNLASDTTSRAKKWIAKSWSNKYDQKSRDAIIKAAANQKVPEDYLFGMAMIESQGDPNARTPSGTYKGLFQFGPDAWKTYGSGDPYDPDANALAGAKYMRANITALQRAKIPITLGNVYLAHQQGLGGTFSLHRLARTGGEPSGQLRKHMDSNSGKGLSPSSFLNMWGYITENLKQKAYKLRNTFKGGSGPDNSKLSSSVGSLQTINMTEPQETTFSGSFLSNAASRVSSGIKSMAHHIATGAKIVGSSVATGVGIAGNKILSAAQSMKGMGEKVQPEKMVTFLNRYSGTTFNEINKTPWCARYVSATLESQGIKSTRSASAASYLKYGQSIWDKTKGSAGLANARPGDIAIFSRKGGNHVAFVESVDPSSGQLRVIGGNQSDHVTEATRSIKDLLAIRRPDEVTGSSDYTPMVQSSDQGTNEGIPVTSGENGKDTNLIQSALGTIGKFAKMAKGGAGAIYDELNLDKFGFKRPEEANNKVSIKTTYVSDTSNQSPITPEEGNRGGLIQNALNLVADFARKAEAVGNANRAKQGRASVQSLVKAFGLEKFGFEDPGVVKFSSSDTGFDAADIHSKYSSRQIRTAKEDLDKYGSTPYINSKYSEITNIPKATQEQRDYVAQVDKENQEQIDKLGFTGITTQQYRLLTEANKYSKGKDAKNLPGFNDALEASLRAKAKNMGDDYDSWSDEEKSKYKEIAFNSLYNSENDKIRGITLEERSAADAKYDVAIKAIKAEENAKLVTKKTPVGTQSRISTPGSAAEQVAAENHFRTHDPGLFGTLGVLTGITDVKDQYRKYIAQKGANQPSIKQTSFDYEQPKKEVWDEQIPQAQTTIGKHTNQTPVTISPTQRGPSSRQSSNVEHRTTVEEINPSRMDPEVDELVWKLFTTVPDIFKKDANLFGTGIMF